MTRTFVCKKKDMKTTAIIEMWGNDSISVYVPDFKGFNLNGQGRTVNEAKQSLWAAVEDYKSMFSEQGKPVPECLGNLEFEYKYDIASFFDQFKFISASSFANYAGVNPSLMRQYKKRLAFASESQKAKIEKAIHMAGAEMMKVRL